MKKIYIISLSIMLCAAGMVASAQQTGVWTETVAFSTPSYPGQTRSIAFYVPGNYSASTKYKLMVLLHGQSDNPTNFVTYQSTLMDGYSVQWSHFPNGFLTTEDFILVAPSEGIAGSGFIDPPGEDDGIDGLAVSEAKRLYNIDATKIYLCGFSFGGRAALHIGLEHYQNYHGLMFWTPAVASAAEAENGGGTFPYYGQSGGPCPQCPEVDSATYDYANGKIIPSCMTVGDADPYGFTPTDETVDAQFNAANAKCYFTILGTQATYWNGQSEHNTPLWDTSYFSCFNFISANAATSIQELMQDKLGMMVYPDPATSYAKIALGIPKEELEKSTTTLFNTLGQQVLSVTNGYNNEGELYIDVHDLPVGVYIVKVNTVSLSFERKLLIER